MQLLISYIGSGFIYYKQTLAMSEYVWYYHFWLLYDLFISRVFVFVALLLTMYYTSHTVCLSANLHDISLLISAGANLQCAISKYLFIIMYLLNLLAYLAYILKATLLLCALLIYNYIIKSDCFY